MLILLLSASRYSGFRDHPPGNMGMHIIGELAGALKWWYGWHNLVYHCCLVLHDRVDRIDRRNGLNGTK